MTDTTEEIEECKRRAVGSWIIAAISVIAAVLVATILSDTSRLAEGIGLTLPNIDFVAAGSMVWETGIQIWGYLVAAGVIVWEAIGEISLWLVETMQSLIN